MKELIQELHNLLNEAQLKAMGNREYSGYLQQARRAIYDLEDLYTEQTGEALTYKVGESIPCGACEPTGYKPEKPSV